VVLWPPAAATPSGLATPATRAGHRHAGCMGWPPQRGSHTAAMRGRAGWPCHTRSPRCCDKGRDREEGDEMRDDTKHMDPT
jgi:hypothetical protein